MHGYLYKADESQNGYVTKKATYLVLDIDLGVLAVNHRMTKLSTTVLVTDEDERILPQASPWKVC